MNVNEFTVSIHICSTNIIKLNRRSVQFMVCKNLRTMFLRQDCNFAIWFAILLEDPVEKTVGLYDELIPEWGHPIGTFWIIICLFYCILIWYSLNVLQFFVLQLTAPVVTYHFQTEDIQNTYSSVDVPEIMCWFLQGIKIDANLFSMEYLQFFRSFLLWIFAIFNIEFHVLI